MVVFEFPVVLLPHAVLAVSKTRAGDVEGKKDKLKLGDTWRTVDDIQARMEAQREMNAKTRQLQQQLCHLLSPGLSRAACLSGWTRWEIQREVLTLQYRPRTLDDLQYHDELSSRLKSLVRVWWMLTDLRLRRATFHISCSTVLLVQERRCAWVCSG